MTDLERAVMLYRTAIGKARDCCGCGDGYVEECAADILAGHGQDWTPATVEKARQLLEVHG